MIRDKIIRFFCGRKVRDIFTASSYSRLDRASHERGYSSVARAICEPPGPFANRMYS